MDPSHLADEHHGFEDDIPLPGNFMEFQDSIDDGGDARRVKSSPTIRSKFNGVANHHCFGNHILFQSGRILWCNKCGSFTSGVKRGGLTMICKGEPPKDQSGQARWRALNRLRKGVHPETRKPVGKAAKWERE